MCLHIVCCVHCVHWFFFTSFAVFFFASFNFILYTLYTLTCYSCAVLANIDTNLCGPLVCYTNLLCITFQLFLASVLCLNISNRQVLDLKATSQTITTIRTMCWTAFCVQIRYRPFLFRYIYFWVHCAPIALKYASPFIHMSLQMPHIHR